MEKAADDDRSMALYDQEPIERAVRRTCDLMAPAWRIQVNASACVHKGAIDISIAE